MEDGGIAHILKLFKSHTSVDIGIITSALIGLILLLFLIFDFYSTNEIIPSNYMRYFFGYFAYQTLLLLTMSISQFVKSSVKGVKCLYCNGPLEISKYKCKLCKKLQ